MGSEKFLKVRLGNKEKQASQLVLAKSRTVVQAWPKCMHHCNWMIPGFLGTISQAYPSVVEDNYGFNNSIRRLYIGVGRAGYQRKLLISYVKPTHSFHAQNCWSVSCTGMKSWLQNSQSDACLSGLYRRVVRYLLTLC